MSGEPSPTIPLVSVIETRGAGSSKDSRMTNCFAEKTSMGYACAKRSGLSLFLQGTVGCGQGLVNFLETIYSVSADTLNVNATFTTTFTQTTGSAGWAGREGMMGVGFNGKLWAMGGQNTAGTTFYRDVYNSVDGITWNLITAAAAWGTRASAGLIVFNNLMWIVGGFNGTTDWGDVWYSSDGANWTQANAAAFPGRGLLGITTFNSMMWVAGGQNQAGTAFYNDVWSSLNGITWTLVTANAPWIGRSRLGFAGFNGRLRVIGGQFNAQFTGAGVDLWSSADGISWTRDSSNPFSQAGTGVFSRIAMTSIGAAYGLAPPVTLTGGAGAGAIAITILDDFEDSGDDLGDSLFSSFVTTAGAGYTSAPTVTFGTAGGVGATGRTFLKANGVLGDKRGVLVQAGSILYFFTSFNNGLDTSPNEIWKSTDGSTWTVFQSAPAYGPRDTTAFYLGSFWILSGASSGTNYTDVWKGSLTSSSSFALTPTTTCLPFSFNQTSTTLTNPLLFFKTNKDAYTYNANLSTLTKVTNANYPATTVPGIVYLDTYMFVMDQQGRIWNSAINDPLTWNALGFIPMQGEPNGGVALGKVANYLVALGVWTTQFFYDAAVASPASPLAVNSTLDSLTGCASGDSVVQMQSTIVWLGQNKSEGRGIFQIQNLAPVRISTPFIDRILEADTLVSVRAFATVDTGHSFYVLTLVNSNITLVFDFMDKVWYVWTSRAARTSVPISSLTCDPYGLVTVTSTAHGLADGDPVTISGATVTGYNGIFNATIVSSSVYTYLVPSALAANPGAALGTSSTEGYFIGRGAASLGGSYYIQHETNGGVYQFNPAAYDDFGNPIDMRSKSHAWDGGTTRNKTFPNIALVADVNSSRALLRYTNDDYNTYSTYRSIDMSIIRQHLTRNGRARRRAYEFRHTAATDCRVYHIELFPEGGTF